MLPYTSNALPTTEITQHLFSYVDLCNSMVNVQQACDSNSHGERPYGSPLPGPPTPVRRSV